MVEPIGIVLGGMRVVCAGRAGELSVVCAHGAGRLRVVCAHGAGSLRVVCSHGAGHLRVMWAAGGQSLIQVVSTCDNENIDESVVTRAQGDERRGQELTNA